ncbi:hypothetical protein HPB52_001513 [Rhipicephalus sanguineus]|uniref:Uncharacterized protein n=1 Tax=Rhipicephalus sanguineus TaxID=34632 RepID=A0A9D4T0Q2_RHISA|nr:hypothetical protein HPB52_001513 [Rhipicephalus sanguineus]
MPSSSATAATRPRSPVLPPSLAARGHTHNGELQLPSKAQDSLCRDEEAMGMTQGHRGGGGRCHHRQAPLKIKDPQSKAAPGMGAAPRGPGSSSNAGLARGVHQDH